MRSRSRRGTLTALTLGVSVIATLITAPTTTTAATATNNPDFTANVMAPLVVTDWAQFESQLQTVKNYGVDAVTADVWWGSVESAGDNQFNWSYYDTLFQKITAKGLKIVPIFSFHQCGGNVGDTCNIPLPSWLWSKYSGQTLNGITLDANGLKHKSEQGNFSNETVQGWADQLVLNEYREFTAAFTARYATTYANSIQEVNVSLGPAGELRYPSYNGHDSGSGYPSRGAAQWNSPLAIRSFQQFAVAKYGSVSGVNSAWGSSVTSQSQIEPPSDTAYFFSSGDYRNIQYGKDLIDWYNSSLVDHGERMLNTVITALGTSFPAAKIGYKIPGVHWSMSGATPRAAEVAAGLVRTSVDMNAANTGHGYANMVNLATKFANTGREMVLHFTCLEFNDENYAPQYSQAKTLVGWLGAEADRQGVAIKGENALSGGVTNDTGWNNINNAFDNYPYIGMTVLRVGEVASGTGTTRYAEFIQKYRAVPQGESVTVKFAEWQSASSYSIHTWNGLSGTYPMTYEGFINNRHWWSVTLANAPSNFGFTFTNSNGNWDTADRTYTQQGSTIYVLPGSANVSTTRP